tara:strand:- start:1722 stop:1910 length:189 start_codon:yes stop_codon:yes gene_type:complete
MDEVTLMDFIKKKIKDRENQIQETLMSGSLKDIEHYKYLQGELSALYYIANELQQHFKDKTN